jgi:hypothetical protein
MKKLVKNMSKHNPDIKYRKTLATKHNPAKNKNKQHKQKYQNKRRNKYGK